MPRLEVDKERFKSFLAQFIGDAPYQVELVDTLFSQMPIQVRNNMIEEYYYKYIFKGETYKAQHMVYQADIHMFPNLDGLKKFLIDRSMGTIAPEFFNSCKQAFFDKKIQEHEPIAGYYITKEVL
jgi:hypothetical protein